jgi:hypothetical protein
MKENKSWFGPDDFQLVPKKMRVMEVQMDF